VPPPFQLEGLDYHRIMWLWLVVILSFMITATVAAQTPGSRLPRFDYGAYGGTHPQLLVGQICHAAILSDSTFFIPSFVDI